MDRVLQNMGMVLRTQMQRHALMLQSQQKALLQRAQQNTLRPPSEQQSLQQLLQQTVLMQQMQQSAALQHAQHNFLCQLTQQHAGWQAGCAAGQPGLQDLQNASAAALAALPPLRQLSIGGQAATAPGAPGAPATARPQLLPRPAAAGSSLLGAFGSRVALSALAPLRSALTGPAHAPAQEPCPRASPQPQPALGSAAAPAGASPAPADVASSIFAKMDQPYGAANADNNLTLAAKIYNCRPEQLPESLAADLIDVLKVRLRLFTGLFLIDRGLPVCLLCLVILASGS